jgi:7-cyano-7-deazaguanine synthase
VPEGQAGTPIGGNEIPSAYVPFRNAHFLAVAVSWAEVSRATAVFIGAVAEDSSGYPDCPPEYYRVFQQLVREDTRPKTHIEIVTPVNRLPKWEAVKRGMELGAPLDRTWSCYQFEDAACGAYDIAGCGSEHSPKRGSAILSPIGSDLRDNNEPRG